MKLHVIVFVATIWLQVGGESINLKNVSYDERETCLPHSPKVNCSFLPFEFIECDELVDNKGNKSLLAERGYGCLKFGGQRYEDVQVGKAKCKVLEDIQCCGKREFLRDGFPCVKYNNHYFVTTLIYSILLGFLGMDRFCLGHTGTAVGKLLTLGGVGIWWVVDIVLIVAGSLTPKDESNWNPNKVSIMAKVTYFSINKFRYFGNNDPNESIHFQENSLRDNLLNNILSNQLRKRLEVGECLKTKEKFVASSTQNFSDTCKGLISNELYKKFYEELDVKEVLSYSGLNSNEIDLLLDENRNFGNCTEESYLQRLKDIEKKLEEREASLQNTSKEHFSKALKLNRHDYEDECNKVCSERAEKLSSLFKLEPYKDESLPSEHPINNLSDLEKKLFPDTKIAPFHKRTSYGNFKTQVKYYREKPETLWDMKARPILLTNDEPSKTLENVGFTSAVAANFSQTTTVSTNNKNNCNKKHKIKRIKKCFPVKSGNISASVNYSKPFVWNLKPSELVPISEITKNSISVEEIKRIPKFIKYSPGTPSAILFIKNLPHKINPLNIVSLFGNFEIENEAKIEYRILKGKMKGQAFVKFKKSEVSEKAFNICNGYLMGDRPIIIEYGKQNL